ncbi:TPA_asm: Tn3 family transposase [Salmonella enterica subsp. houtenae serovar 45:g,z51:-]|uniref:Tn3 family transposase n=1 Tax=Salmonella enterica subsp. houtenae serovar 45:g,z51:- TaxID=1967611 RepID=A0A736R8G1_SALHO|nr:Tn3 family transposase [Salmonella enterica subsp. houtenae str. CFSAN000557]HAE7767900.1 Tn3 family transposase [Salmonella enterica subsp. houtenae serovar 45:g,z51:-]
MQSKKKRIRILTNNEINELYQIPSFSAVEREEYFSLDKELRTIINGISKIENRIYMILIIGYFRYKPVIHDISDLKTKKNIKYIVQEYYPKINHNLQITISKRTKSRLTRSMLSILGFRQLTPELKKALIIRLKDVATICMDPKYILDELLAFLGQQRIALPGYSTVQDLISEVLNYERLRISNIISKQMTNATAEKINSILHNEGKLNEIRGYSGNAKDFSPSEIDKELCTHSVIGDIYYEVKNVINALDISPGNMNYYATIVKHSTTFSLKRHPKWQGILYLCCYLYFRYRDINDKIITAFRYLLKKHSEASVLSAKQRVTEEIDLVNKKMKFASDVFNCFIDKSLEDTIPFGEVRKKVFSLIPEDDLCLVSQFFDKKQIDATEYQWQYIDSNHHRVANSIRKLFMAIDIVYDEEKTAIGKQIKTTRDELKKNGVLDSTDQRIIRPAEKSYIVNEGAVNTERFEFHMYTRVSNLLENGSIYSSESEKNKRLEDDLIDAYSWGKNQSALIEKTGLVRLTTPIDETLSELESRLNEQLKKVTISINSDANEFVKKQPKSSKLQWSLASKKWKTSIDNPVYKQIKNIGIVDVMKFVNAETDFLSVFNAVSSRKNNLEADHNDLLACIFGNGANYGIQKIANSSDRSISTLRGVNDKFIRPEITELANDVVSDAISMLPIFKYWTINEDSPFGSIDGQKHSCRINTFKTRFSSKYFRKGKGVSAMTLVSNHVPLATVVISPNEYEGHFAFDLLYNNSSEIQPKSLATDNHGVNNVNFAILDIYDYQFSPRYAKFKNIFNSLFEVELIDDELVITLRKLINNKLIISEWNNIQHIICSLSRKMTEQSTVIKKLSNTKRNSKTLEALREYDRLVRCIYVLNYVDDKTLRQFVQQALNRGEAYHQLRRAIASVNGNQFRGGSDYQIDQWNDCARLIANCIIYYNAAILSGLVEKCEEQGNKEAIDVLANLSPVAWGHILLGGNYSFEEQAAITDLDGILENVDPLSEEDEDID